MKPVRPNDRGPAVEDIQRRLLALGYDLGRTGVDGVFLGATADAVRSFQAEHELAEDGLVGERTWSALVDASFALGDRMLYLRLPHFHGHDVIVLQQALNALGFACGHVDGIFGAFTERAVREFQRNAGVLTDGIVGDNTVRAIVNLRHVWEGKGARAHSAARIEPARAAAVLERAEIAVTGMDDAGRGVAERLANLAGATTPKARLHLLGENEDVAAAGTILRICGASAASSAPGLPVVRVEGDEDIASRLFTALEALPGADREVVIELDVDRPTDEMSDQRAAVLLLDALCVVFD
jgi:peptidoglycan hydrolase-like protein with peptidoglycan-binding domain